MLSAFFLFVCHNGGVEQSGEQIMIMSTPKTKHVLYLDLV